MKYLRMMILSLIVSLTATFGIAQEWVGYNYSHIQVQPQPIIYQPIQYQYVYTAPVVYQYVPVISYTPVVTTQYHLFCRKEKVVYLPTVVRYDLRQINY